MTQTMTPVPRTRKDPYPTSLNLSREELLAIDRILARAREIDPQHPMRDRSGVIKYALYAFFDDPLTQERILQSAMLIEE